jgi:D-3-phosphoglycerate dehydrogenase / 2-oxoglutarate reductase
VARRAKGFEMKIIAHDPFVSASVARDKGIELAELEQVFSSADYLTLHVGLTPQTVGMINEKSLARMKKGVRIINCARGELLDERAVAAALAGKQIGGLAVDVFTEEPPRNSPLLALENVIATPHIAGSTNEAQDAVGVQIASQVREDLKRGVIQNAVNMPSIDHQQYTQMQPYIALAEKLGAFLANVAPGSGSIQEISLGYRGRIVEWNTELIRNAAIQGVLNQRAAEHVNVVNAAAIAHERGIQVHESKKNGAGDAVEVRLKTTGGERQVRGGVLPGNSLRLLGVDAIGIEVPLAGNLIFFRNLDVPGVIGKIGTLLGRHKVNIGNFALGRSGEKGNAEAIAVVEVDSPAPEEVLEELRRLPEFQEVRGIRI